jgi:hypothetical protein
MSSFNFGGSPRFILGDLPALFEYGVQAHQVYLSNHKIKQSYKALVTQNPFGIFW